VGKFREELFGEMALKLDECGIARESTEVEQGRKQSLFTLSNNEKCISWLAFRRIDAMGGVRETHGQPVQFAERQSARVINFRPSAA
jgi:hypothetical protein